MALETILREACSALSSDRVGERKKNAETLKSYLTSNSAPILLSSNQRNRSGYNWEDVFEQVNEYVLKECEKFESSKTFVNTKSLCTSLLHMTIAGANRHGCYIKTDLAISASMHILKSSRLRRAFGDAYLVLLHKHVMPHDTYLGFIKPQEWEDLLSVSLQLCYRKQVDIDPVFAGRFLLQVVQKGTNYCHFTIKLRDKIADTLRILLQEDLDKKLQEIMLNIAIHFVETLSTECRLTMCEFVEELIPTFLRFYDQTSDMERTKKVLLFHFLTISTSIHNPRGRPELEGGSLAADWDVWRGHLRSMYKLVNIEAVFLGKMYRDSKLKCNIGRNLDVSSWFIQLAAQLFHQVCCLRNSAESTKETGSYDEIPAKRIKLEKEYEFDSLPELLRRLPNNIYPWLRVLDKLFGIENFKENISEEDLSSLLDVLISIMSDNNDTDAEYGFIFPVMSRVIDLIFNKQWYDLKLSYVDKIWDVCIRQCILKKDYNCHVHEIFQKILNSNAASERMLLRLIKLYTDQCVEMSNETLNTLNIILTKNIKNYVKYSVKVQLMSWFVKHGETLHNMEALTEVLFKLIIKEIIPFRLNEIKSPTEDCAYNILFHTTEDNILVSEFELDLSIFEIKASQTPKIDIYVTKYDNLFTDLMNIFDSKLSKFTDNNITDTSAINECLKNIHMILQFYKLILQYRVCVENEMFRDPVLMKVKGLFSTLYMSISKKVHDEKTADSEKISILTLLMDVYKTQYYDYIDSSILSIGDENFFQTLFAKCNLDSSISVDEADGFIDVTDTVETNENVKSVSFCFMSYYCLKNLEYRADVLDFILDSDLYNFSNNEDVECALRVLEILLQCEERDLPVEMIFRFMQKMCKALFRNIAATIKITEMLYKLIPAIGRSDLEYLRTNCVIMLRGFVHRCEAHYYPVHYTALVYKSISKIICLAQTQNWNTSLRDNLLKGLYSDIHGIRLYTCYKLEDIARTLEVQSLNEMVEVIFQVEANDAMAAVLRDESVNRTATVLHFLVSFAISSPKLILKSISAILETTAVKNLDQILVKKVLTLIVSRVSQENLHEFLQMNLEHFVNHWLSKRLELNTLVHTLFGYQSFESMLCSHFSLMMPAEIFWNHNGHINLSQLMTMLKNILNCTDREVISECFCQMMRISLPHVVTDKYKVASHWGATTADANSAKIMFDEVRDILGNDEASILFAYNIGNLLKLFTQHLYDKDNMMESIGCSVALVDCVKFYFPFRVYKALQQYLSEIADCDILLEQCNTAPFSVQSVLLELWSDIERERKLDSKLLSLYRYITFCNSIPLNTRFSHYFIKFVISSLLHTMRKNYEDQSLSKTTPVACLCLFDFLNKVLPEHAEIIDNLLPNIVDILSIIHNDESDEYVTKTLLLLLRDMKSMLVNSLDVVDRLPDRLVSKMSSMNLNVSLSQEDLEGIIKKVNSAGTGCSYKTLNHLYNSLKNDTMALKELFKRCRKLRGFSEDCRNSILHQLVLNLTKIAVDVADSQCRLESTKCLGVIGPADLKTFVLATPEDPSLIVELEPLLYFTLTCLKETKKLIFNSEPEIIRKASFLLNSILSFEEGRTALEYLDNSISTDELMPYLPTKRNVPSVNININPECFAQNINCSELWIPSKATHKTWVTNLATFLIQSLSDDKNFLKFLANMCRLQPSLCEEILPSLVGFVMCRAEKEQINIFRDNINNFFRHHFEKLSPLSQDSNGGSQADRNQDYEMMVNSNKRSIQLLLRVVDFVRLQSSHYTKRPKEQQEHYNFLKLDYQAVAWAAFATGENISAVMYGELWCTARNNGVPPPGPHATAEIEGGDVMQDIFRNSYVAIGDMDAVYGCGLGHLQSESERRNHYLRLGSFNEAILSHDLSLAHTTDVGLQNGLVKSLYASGLYHLAAQYMKTMPENNHLNDIKYECYMRLGDWSLLPDPSVLPKEELSLVSLSSIKQAVTVHQYACLKEAITGTTTEGRESILETIIQNARESVAILLDKSNVKTCRKLYETVAQMQVIEDIHLFSKMRFQHYEPSDVLGYWTLSNLLPVNDFNDIEPVLAVRAYMLEHIARSNIGLIEDVVNVQLDYAELGLQNGRQQFSSRLLSIASRLHPGGRASLIEGKVAWTNGHQELGLHLVKTVMNNSELNNNLLKANALRQYGSWMIETKSENAKDIHDKYLKKSLEVLNPNEHSETKLKVYLDIAKFADAEFKQVVTYIKSAIFENKVKCMEKMRGTANSLKLQDPTQQNLSRDERKTLVMNDKLSLLDETDISNTYADKAKFLNLAVKYYLLSLGQGELNDLCIFRVISLWFANSDLALDSQSEFTLSQLFEAVPSRKFLPVLPQIAPRLSMDKTLFNGYLTRIIERCSLDHPHHTLPILLALNNSHKDKIIINMNEKNQSPLSSSRSRATKPSTELSIKEEPRVIAARQLLAKISNTDSNMGAIISQMEMMCNAMISLANYKIPKEDMKAEMSIPRAEPLTKLKALDLVLVPTITLPVDKHCLYHNITSVVSFSNKFNLVGGVNAPKKLLCKGSDGMDRPILLKGEDDLRQDAVMQQVFNIVNSLLATNRETSRSGLLIRTYKVVALSHRSGVLEWCSGTEPLAAYLIGHSGDGGAHSRYRPRDISARAARMMMVKCRGKSNEEKLNVFVKLLSHFKPVLHHFFNERFLSPVTWYERRYAYTNSVATSSMVGYMLGIGDRHVQNILIDKETAEVIHIDFGIAFDQGRALPTPETVPFRLTQDMTAGFGASGVEGLFRRSCEKTLQLLRDNQETLLTIVEVLLYDPLYSWSVSPSQARKKQNVSTDQKETHDNANISGEAERALLVLQSKLEGRADGAVGSMGMGVAGQIARLIQQATDISNLSRLFDGWQPYL